MVNDETYRDAVYNVQSALAYIAKYDPSISRVIPDGIYGDETAKSAAQFQASAGLPQTGRTDIRTHGALFDRVQTLKNKHAAPLAVNPFLSPLYRGRLSSGDSGELVFILQSMLAIISPYCDSMGEIKITGVYDEPTAAAVRILQAAGGLEPTGDADTAAWNVISRLFNHYISSPVT
ncbi:MAG: peptidoglycan-binding domain-containing protein [Eubacteriales bacterium]